MKKRRLGCLLAILLCVSLSAPAFAWSETPLLVDNADLLDDSEASALLALLEEISSERQMDVAVVTVDDLYGEPPYRYADDFYDENGYAADGVLLLVSMAESDWYISTAGYGTIAITDDALEYLAEQLVYDLSDEQYYNAFATYAEYCDLFIEAAQNGEPFELDDAPKPSFPFLKSLLISLVIGFVAALIITGSMKAKLKTIRSQPAATDYVKADSMHVTHARDLFLYRHVDRRAKPKESGSGGSRTHVSPSGRTHGGGGGKF